MERSGRAYYQVSHRSRASPNAYPDELHDLLPKHFKQLDILGNSAELFDGTLLALFLVYRCGRLGIAIDRRFLRLAVGFRFLRSFLRRGAGPRIFGLRRYRCILWFLARHSGAFDTFCQPLGRFFLCPLPLFRILIVRFSCGVRCKAVDEGDNDLLNVDPRVEGGGGFQKGTECVKMKVVRKDLQSISANCRQDKLHSPE